MKGILWAMRREKDMYIRQNPMDESCRSFEYSSGSLAKVLHLVRKYRDLRELCDDDKLTWMLQHGSVDYLSCNRGQILFEQDESRADSYFLLLRGRVTLIRTFVDHDLLYQLKKDRRLCRALQHQISLSSRQSQDTQSVGAIVEEASSDEILRNSSPAKDEPVEDQSGGSDEHLHSVKSSSSAQSVALSSPVAEEADPE
jgi:hypothetical protein